MADGVTGDVDTSAVVEALTELGAFAQPYVNDAAHETADAIVREAQSRLKRQLGPNATGLTVSDIHDQPAYDGNGFVVISDREPMPNLPLWLEKGTKKGKPGSHSSAAKPYFYVSCLVEEGAHERRIADAVQRAIDDRGLGMA